MKSLKAKKKILRSQLNNLQSTRNEQKLEKEIRDFFTKIGKRVQNNLPIYWNDNLLVGQLTYIIEPIIQSHQEYYEILEKHIREEYQLGADEAERIMEELDIPPNPLFGTQPLTIDDLLNKVFTASQRTLTRVDENINQILTDGYKSGEGINKVANDLTKRFNQLQTWEAKRIARTEIHNSHNRATMDKYNEYGVQYTMWVAADDNRTRISHREIDGEIIRLGDTYSNGLRYPGDTDGALKEWINCRCSNAPYVVPYGYIAPNKPQFKENELIKIR